MSVVLSANRAQLEATRRGWSLTDLAREAGLSIPTVSAALNGRPVSVRTLRLIASAFAQAPVLQGADDLLPLGHTGS
jgi:transcriptional regulator with XRE-family HTH domain